MKLFTINEQILYAFLLNIRNYSPEVINIEQHKADLHIILLKVNNFDINKQKHEIFALLCVTNTK